MSAHRTQLLGLCAIDRRHAHAQNEWQLKLAACHPANAPAPHCPRPARCSKAQCGVSVPPPAAGSCTPGSSCASDSGTMQPTPAATRSGCGSPEGAFRPRQGFLQRNSQAIYTDVPSRHARSLVLALDRCMSLAPGRRTQTASLARRAIPAQKIRIRLHLVCRDLQFLA